MIYYMYDGIYWVWMNSGSLDGNIVPSIQIETSAIAAAKVGTCTNYTLLANSYAHANVRYANTRQSALTLNVNSTGAKRIYINGTESSASNYTLPAGTYIIYYDGTNYHFRTDGVLPGSILNATNATNDSLGRKISNTYALGSDFESFTSYVEQTYSKSDAKTSSSNKTGTKLYLVGATTQSTTGQTTYSNSNCYVGTDNSLYSGGKKVSVDGHEHPMLSVNYLELVNLRDNGQLIPGQQYRIIDYITTTSQENTESAGHQFDIIVTANSNNTLNEIARACIHEGDTYFSENNANLSAWQIWYCLDNDTDKFEWATTTGYTYNSVNQLYEIDKDKWVTAVGKVCIDQNLSDAFYETGINEKFSHFGYSEDLDGITRLTLYGRMLDGDIDEGLSMTPHYYSGVYKVDGQEYDGWAQLSHDGGLIKYAADENGNPIYILTERIVKDENSLISGDEEIIIGKGVIYRMIDEWGNDCPYDFKNIKFTKFSKTYTTDSNFYYTFCSYDGNSSNIKDFSVFRPSYDNVYNNVIKPYYYDTKQSLNRILFIGSVCHCNSNTFDTNCYYNTFGTNCCENTFGNWCYYNIFGEGCCENTFGSDCFNNEFGNGCESNTFDNDCFDNKFGSNCESNTFGANCYSNKFGEECQFNTFGANCYSNTFGINCDYNTFGNGCVSNTFGDSCKYNTFGNYCESNTFGNGCESNTFGNLCKVNEFGHKCNLNKFAEKCEENKLGKEATITISTNCAGNIFGNYCYQNTFGICCVDNIFGNHCYGNKFGTSCYGNTFGNDCYQNTFGTNCEFNLFGEMCGDSKFGNHCYDNTFGNGCFNIKFGEMSISSGTVTIKSYYRNITFDDMCESIYLNCEKTTSTSSNYQNVKVDFGVSDMSINDTNVNQTYLTIYKPKDVKTITV